MILLRRLIVLAFLCGATLYPSGAATSAAGQATQTTARARVDAERLLADVRVLSGAEFAGRQTGSAGNRLAQAFILQRFRDLGLQRVNGTREQHFSVTLRPRGTSPPPAKPDEVRATNLIAMIEGTAQPHRFILVGAHFDHLGVRDSQIYPGADDNASGVAGMLAAAAWLAGNRPRSSVLFVAFDAEEQGLQGARHFVKTPPVDLRRLAVVVNLDMIGRGDANQLWAAGTYHYPHLKDPVVGASRDRPIKVVFGHDRPKAGDDWTNSSDHGPFHAAGVPFLYFGVEDHPDYHKPTDTADRIPRAFYAEAVELVTDLIERLANDASPAQGEEPKKRPGA